MPGTLTLWRGWKRLADLTDNLILGILMIAARKHAKPETAAPMNTPQIIPTAKAYLTIPCSALWLNRPRRSRTEHLLVRKSFQFIGMMSA